jgi:hypothetical protein
MEDTLFSTYDPVDWWIDRLGNMEFIEDQKSGSILNPAFWHHMIRVADIANVNPSSLF